MKIPKVILSHKRPGRVTTLNHINDCILCVEKSQYEDYRKYYPDIEILTHPDEIKGASWKRNWIYKKFGDVFMLDDNITGVMRMYPPSGYKRPTKVSADITTMWIDDLYHIAKYEYKVKLFGFASEPYPFIYTGAQPIQHNHFTQGRALGVIEDDKLFFEETDTFEIEDVFIFYLNAYYHRLSICDTRIHFIKKMNTNVGGWGDLRTYENIKKNYIKMRRYFGEMINTKHSDPRYFRVTKPPY